jgi:hypothetical protein
VGRGVDHIAMSHEEVKEYGVQVSSLENEADRVSRDAISELFEKETNPIAVIKWKRFTKRSRKEPTGARMLPT